MNDETAKWVRTKSDAAAVAGGCYFDLAAAERVREFLRRFCRHSKGRDFAGKPLELLPWQWNDFIAPLFGWKMPNGLRRFRRAYLEVPKKQGKSTLLAGLALYLLTKDGEGGPEVYIAAKDKSQASIIYGESAHMVEQSPALKDELQTVKSQKRIDYPDKMGFVQALSADVPTKDGLNASAVFFDELHRQTDTKLWDILIYAGASRAQPLQISITTAGDDEESVCWEQHDYAAKVRDGLIEDISFLPVIYAADETDDWKAEATWAKANPSLGVTVSVEEMRQACRDSEATPRTQARFKRLRLNIWPKQGNRWIPMVDWDACQDEAVGAELEGRECYAGMDLGSTSDLSNLLLLFPEDDGYSILNFAWCPKDSATERDHKGLLPSYAPWAESGLIRLTDGNVMDYDRIRADIRDDIGKRFKILDIGYDAWAATQIVNELGGDGFKLTPIRQGYPSLSAPSKELERLVAGHMLRHNGDAALRWMVGNAYVEEDVNENIRPVKGKNKQNKIDAVLCLVMALARATVGGGGNGRSVYEDRGVLVL